MTNPQPTRRRWWAPAAIGAIAIVMIAVVVFSDRDGPAADPGPSPAAEGAAALEGGDVAPEPQRVNIERREESDPLAIGAVDAPVALVMISDFQCGFCALWASQTLPAMLDYVEAGDLRIEWRDVALFGDASHRTALAAYAAGAQGEYLAFNQALFASGSAPSAAALSDAGLEELARDLGLDLDRFNEDRNGADAARAVRANIDEAASLGASSTPSFLLNGIPIVGAQPTEHFVQAIESELAGRS